MIASAKVLFQLIKPIRLEQFYPGVILISVREEAIIDVPYEKSFARKELIAFDRLSVLDKEVLFAVGISVCPQTMNLESLLDILKRDLAVAGFYDSVNPALVGLAPCGISAQCFRGHVSTTYTRKGGQVDRRHHPNCPYPSDTSHRYPLTNCQCRTDLASRKLGDR